MPVLITPLNVTGFCAVSPGGIMLITNSALASQVFEVNGVAELHSGSMAIAAELGITDTGQMNVFGGAVMVGRADIGFNTDSATLTINGGTVVATNYFLLASSTDSTGTVWVTGGQLVVTNQGPFVTDVGFNGAGSMTISNGELVLHDFRVGDNGGGVGTFTAAGGTTTVNDYLDAGTFLGSTGTLWITGGQLSVGTITNAGLTLTIGAYGGVAAMTISNGMVETSQLVVGLFSTNSQVVVTGTNSVLTDFGSLTVGQYGASNFVIIADGARVDCAVGIIGDSNSSANANSVLVTGANSQWNTGTLSIGKLGSFNVLSINSNALVQAQTVSVGLDPFQTGNQIMLNENGKLIVSENVIVAVTNQGQASIELAAMATMMIGTNLTMAAVVGSTGLLQVVGGQLTATNGVIGIGNDGTSTNGVGVGHMTVSNGMVLASTILLGSSAGAPVT